VQSSVFFDLAKTEPDGFVEEADLEPHELARLAEGWCPYAGKHNGGPSEVRLLVRGEWAVCPATERVYDAWRIVSDV
jgi:hypothetical protein